MAEIIDGKALAAKIKSELLVRANDFENRYGRKVGLAVIRVGANPASAVYVRNKIKACNECNIRSFSYELDEDTSSAQLIELIHKLNADDAVDGILVQLPLPKHIDERTVLAEIVPQKDADGFHAVNAGKLFLG